MRALRTPDERLASPHTTRHGAAHLLQEDKSPELAAVVAVFVRR